MAIYVLLIKTQKQFYSLVTTLLILMPSYLLWMLHRVSAWKGLGTPVSISKWLLYIYESDSSGMPEKCVVACIVGLETDSPCPNYSCFHYVSSNGLYSNFFLLSKLY